MVISPKYPSFPRKRESRASDERFPWTPAFAGATIESNMALGSRIGQERSMSDASGGPGTIERPVLANEPGDYWGSDAVALMLREVDLPYVALNPGASYRGLHDSLVNLLGNRDPQMLLCLPEEHAVAIAHGYAKVTGQPK